MAKYESKLRKNPKRSKYEVNEHISGNGQAKKRLLPQHAKDIAARTGMNAYKCSVCGSFHVGRTTGQLQADGWKTGRKQK